MNIKHLTLSLLIIAAVSLGASSFYIDLAGQYNLDIPSNLTSFNRLNATFEKFESAQVGISSTYIPILSEIGAVVKGGLNILSLFWDIPDFFGAMIQDTQYYLGLPAWTITLFTAVIVVIITFAILSAWLKWEV